MKNLIRSVLYMLPLLCVGVWATEATRSALSCKDFLPTAQALQRFPNLVGACEGVVERNGELYGRFKAEVRRADSRSVWLYLPVTGRTLTMTLDPDARVLIGNRKVRPGDLRPGQEIHIYLSTDAFSKPAIEEVALTTRSSKMVEYPVTSATDVPTTVKKPAQVVSTVVESTAIVEAVNRETRELKLIDAQGNRFSLTADDVRNFDKIEPRDRIVTRYIESVAIVVAPAGSQPRMGDADTSAVAPGIDKAALQNVQTSLLAASVQSIDATDRLLTLETEDGELRTVKVSEGAQLDEVRVGDQIRVRTTNAVAIDVAKPDED